MLTRGLFIEDHNTVGFLSWHRWFIHLYEETLRSHCGWNKGLVCVALSLPLRHRGEKN